MTFSSWDRPKPDVERNAFVFPTQVTVMAATKTLHSITGKQFLFGLKVCRRLLLLLSDWKVAMAERELWCVVRISILCRLFSRLPPNPVHTAA